MAANEAQETGETVPEHTVRNRIKTWILLDAERHLLALVVLAGCFLSFVGLSQVSPTSLRSAMASSDPVETAFQALVTSIITGVTLVVTITQLVLSQEQGPLGDQRNRMEGSMKFLDDVEGVLDRSVSPPEPAGFLGALLDGACTRASELATAAGELSDRDAGEQIGSYADEIVDDATRVANRLDDAQFGTFDVVDEAIRFRYSDKIYDGRRLRSTHDLPEAVVGPLSELLYVLEFFAPAREHVKTLYFQWELMNLSRAMLYTSLPALIVAVSMILYADQPSIVTGGTLGIDALVWLVSAAVTVALVPFVLLVVYILRIGTVTKRTLAIGPLILQQTDDSSEGGEE